MSDVDKKEAGGACSVAPSAQTDEYDVAAAGTALAIGADCLERMANAFESSARRWELIVYPAMFAFIVLAGYGFYLIYSLTNDVHYIAQTVETRMQTVATEMENISANFDMLSTDIRSVARNIEQVSGDLYAISTTVETLDPMLGRMDAMSRSMSNMTVNTRLMRGDMAHLNQNVGRPMSFMNNFMPW